MSIVHPQLLGASVAATRDSLKAFGIKAHERVAILAPNSVEQFILILSLWQLKAIACPMNGYQPEAVIKAQMAHINARRLIDEKRLKKLVVITKPGQSSTLRIPAMNQPVTILFTSGSSAAPKAVMHSFGNYYCHALAANKQLNLKGTDRWLLSLPLYHVGGLCILFRCFLAGAMVVIPKDRKEALRSLAKDKITHVSLVPTQLHRLLQRPKWLPSLKCMLVGGAPIPPELITRARKFGYPVYTTYGLTETTSQVATSRPAGSGAKILPCIRVKISRESEILVKGKSLFQGYVHGNRLRLPLTKDGWFRTGDLGQYRGGYLTVTGRKDNQFISGGENIQPEEIERHLLTLDGIAQVCVVPRPDTEFGERPVAFIKFDRNRVPRKKIDSFLRTKVAAYKVPDEYYIWPAAAATTALKLSRIALQQHLKSGAKLSTIT